MFFCSSVHFVIAFLPTVENMVALVLHVAFDVTWEPDEGRMLYFDVYTGQ